jgi:CubicO group peptidase (beta-lactamase class C family)
MKTMAHQLFRLSSLKSAALILGAAMSIAVGCTKSIGATLSGAFDRAAMVDGGVPTIIKARRIAGVGIAVIRGYRLVWTNYYGEQGPGVPANRNTMFNTASLAKSITAWTTLRMVSQGKVSLDEPIAAYYVHPDLVGDPRYRMLTPRIILTHRTGLLNWEYNYKDKKLAFVADPDAKFGYSGAAFDILAHFLEKKLHTDFETLVAKTVFSPLGMTGVSMSRKAVFDARVTTPMNSQGVYEAPYTTTQEDWHRGGWSSASDFFVTVDDYSKFFISLMKHEGVSKSLMADMMTVHSSFVGENDWACEDDASLICPDRYGFGLGYLVFDYGSDKLVWVDGNDSGENALAYFTKNAPGDAVIIFVNGGNGVFATTDIVDLVDPKQKLGAYFRQLINRHLHPKPAP